MTEPSLRIEIFPSDLTRSLAFYRALGFSVRTEPKDGYAVVQLGSARIGMLESEPRDAAHRAIPSGTEIVLDLDDVEGVLAAARANGVEPDEDLRERPWGLTDFRVSDPDGYYLRFTSRPR